MKTIKNKIYVMFLILFAASMSSCEDALKETVYDRLTDYNCPDCPVDAIYIAMRGQGSGAVFTFAASEFVWFLESISSDEVSVPMRFSDWSDLGHHRELQEHSWSPVNTNRHILSGWNYAYDIIGACNTELEMGERWGRTQQAQIRLVRAYAYMKLLDWFGNVPIVLENSSGVMPASSKRIDVYNFIKSELEDPIMDYLPPRKTSDQWGEFVMRALRIRLYLNSNVYMSNNLAAPLADSDPAYVENLNKVIREADIIEASGRFSIANNYFSSFYVDNHLPANNSENILTIAYEGAFTEGNYMQMLSHSNRSGFFFGITVMEHCVNGPCLNPGRTGNATTGIDTDPNSMYNILNEHPNDIRRLSILTGTRNADTGAYEALRHRTTGANLAIIGVPIRYQPYFTGGFTGISAGSATRSDGARIVKYELTPGTAWEMDNDWVLIRYAEVIYSRAEAKIRLGQDATSDFQMVLSRRGYDGKTLSYDGSGLSADDYASKRNIATTALNIPVQNTLDFMERELAREFIFEGHRRTNMIRFGKFLGTWGLKTTVSPGYRTLYSIPDAVIRVQQNVRQNPGYPGYTGWTGQAY